MEEIPNVNWFGDPKNKQLLENNECFHCGSQEFVKTIKIISSGRQCHLYYPQIKIRCKSCGKYKAFARQTPEIIDAFNQKMEGVEL